MARRKRARRAQKRDNRERKRKRQPKPAPTVWRHDVYGDIPLITKRVEVAPGQVHEYEGYDPDYKPPLPAGAVRGNVHKQDFCPMCHVPRYFFVDKERECVQCGEGFVFSAREQKYWYESLRFHFDSTAVRCKDCRRKRRSVKALNTQVGAVLARLKETPDDPAHLLELAETTVALRERTGAGDLDRAIAAARKAGRLWPEHAPALFWEARCHAAAGRAVKAHALLERFTDTRGVKQQHRALWRDARRRLD